ncbi:MAG: hypothetical protein HQM12_04090 [SAR324 cluster bacterium]|nr:hypothetical protein [SAR324 cluster bacterium]
MQKAIWTDELCCGVESIDSQNKLLIGFFSDYYTALAIDDNFATIKDILSFIRSHIVKQFAHEEALMELNKDPFYLMHQSAHREFIDAYKKTLDDYRINRDFEKLKTDLDYMFEWFLLHIEIWDKQLGDYLKECDNDSRNSKYQWTTSLSCFLTKGDEQHQELFNKFGDYAANSQAQADSTSTFKMLEFLHGYLTNHFSDEEVGMKKFGYPHYEQHRKEHINYIDKYKAMLLEFQQQQDHTKLHENAFDMYDTLVKHIKRSDLNMGFYIKIRVMQRHTKKRIVIVCQEENLSSSLENEFSTFGFSELIVTKDEIDAWEWVKTDTVSLLVIASDHDVFQGADLLFRVRGGKEDTPVLLLPNQKNCKNLESTLKGQKLRTADNLIEIRPYDLGKLLHKIDEKIFKHRKGPITI